MPFRYQTEVEKDLNKLRTFLKRWRSGADIEAKFGVCRKTVYRWLARVKAQKSEDHPPLWKV